MAVAWADGNNGSTTASSTITPTISPEPAEGALKVAVIASGDAGEDTPTADEGNWTQIGTFSGGGGTFGGGTGPRRLTYFILEHTSGHDLTPTFSVAGGSTMLASIQVFTKAADEEWDVEVGDASFGEDTSAGTGFSATTAANIGVDSGDMVVFGTAIRDSATHSSGSISATGATFANISERNDQSSETGNDLALGVWTADVTAGPSSAACVISATLSGSETGAAGVIRIRAVSSGTDINLGLATETDSALALTKTVDKTLGLPSETDTALAMTKTVSKTLGLPNEVDSALAMTVEAGEPPIEVNLGLPTETDTALAMTKTVEKSLGMPTETDTALALTIQVEQLIALGLITETDTALEMGKTVVKEIGLPTETDTAIAMGQTVAEALFEFRPPEYESAESTRPLFRYYRQRTAHSVVRIDGDLQTYDQPPQHLLNGLVEGTDYFLGGRVYEVNSLVRAELVAAGYTVE